MNIRVATQNDFPAMLEMGARMHAIGKYSFLPYDRKKLTKLANILHASQDGLLAIALDGDVPVGMIIGYAEEYYFCHEKLARDLLVWVEESERGGLAGSRLIGFFEDWAKSRGAVETCLCDTNGGDSERIGGLYRRLGYERIGGIYKRRLG